MRGAEGEAAEEHRTPARCLSQARAEQTTRLREFIPDFISDYNQRKVKRIIYTCPNFTHHTYQIQTSLSQIVDTKTPTTPSRPSCCHKPFFPTSDAHTPLALQAHAICTPPLRTHIAWWFAQFTAREEQISMPSNLVFSSLF